MKDADMTPGQQGIPQPAADRPPLLAELVTDEDVKIARATLTRAGMRVALQKYGRRLIGRLGATAGQDVGSGPTSMPS
jgi:hypothetical protein